MVNRITTAKGKLAGYIAISGGFTTVIWTDGIAMTFKGNASVMFENGELVVDTTSIGTISSPKSMVKAIRPLTRGKESLRMRMHLFSVLEWQAMDLRYNKDIHQYRECWEALESIVLSK